MIDSSNVSQESSNTDDELSCVVDEILEKLQKNQPVDLDDYELNYPELGSRLRLLFPTLNVLVELGLSVSGTKAKTKSALEDVVEQTGTLGDFRILREIGRGGMGVVYEVVQISLNRHVALKVLPFASVLDPRQLQRFKIEATVAARLKHPNIVTVFGTGCERGVHYYAMDYIEGITLADVIAQALSVERPSQNLDERSVISHQQSDGDTLTLAKLATEQHTNSTEWFGVIAELGSQVAEALDYAHQQGVVHRDINPSNLMIDAQGKIWVTDFGLAQIETNTELTMTGDVIGTLRYISPEQASGKSGFVDHRTDVYSLGGTGFASIFPIFLKQPSKIKCWQLSPNPDLLSDFHWLWTGTNYV